ncbi:MBL fold metallo-hydrolase [Viridibacillus soli]|uniref:hypothetical protein n=1 Tax=Viridibacillus soli TaxID=2798301 RepID=UPI001F27111F|nr:hypothetical protein [Viridibacillus soli]
MKKINLLLIFSLSASLFISVPSAEAASNVKVHVIDVGQGDEVVEYLKKQKVKTLNAVVSTHPEAEYVGGLAEVIDT